MRRIFGDNYLSIHKMKNPQLEHVSFVMMESESKSYGGGGRSQGRAGGRQPASKYKSFSRSRNNVRR